MPAIHEVVRVSELSSPAAPLRLGDSIASPNPNIAAEPPTRPNVAAICIKIMGNLDKIHLRRHFVGRVPPVGIGGFFLSDEN